MYQGASTCQRCVGRSSSRRGRWIERCRTGQWRSLWATWAESRQTRTIRGTRWRMRVADSAPEVAGGRLADGNATASDRETARTGTRTGLNSRGRARPRDSSCDSCCQWFLRWCFPQAALTLHDAWPRKAHCKPNGGWRFNIRKLQHRRKANYVRLHTQQ